MVILILKCQFDSLAKNVGRQRLTEQGDYSVKQLFRQLLPVRGDLNFAATQFDCTELFHTVKNSSTIKKTNTQRCLCAVQSRRCPHDSEDGCSPRAEAAAIQGRR